MSAYGSAADHQACAHTGFARHLVKPMDIDTLARTLLEVPQRARSNCLSARAVIGRDFATPRVLAAWS